MKLYGFRLYNIVPMKEGDRFIHELEGEIHKSRIDLVGHSSITNYRKRVDVGDNVYPTFADAKAEAKHRLAERVAGLIEELSECQRSLLELEEEKP